MSVEFQKYITPIFTKSSNASHLNKSKMTNEGDSNAVVNKNASPSDADMPEMTPEERLVKTKVFINNHVETRRRSAIVDYTLSGASLGGLSGYLFMQENKKSSFKPVAYGALSGACVGLVLGNFVVPWVAHSEGKALTEGDELGIKTYGYSDFIERDNIGIPGSNLITALITGKLLFSQ